MKGLSYEWSFWSFSRVLDQSPRNMAGIPSKLLFPSIWKITLTSIPPKWMAPTKASPLQSFSKLAGGWLLSQVPLLSDIMWRNGSLFYAVECVIWRFEMILCGECVDSAFWLWCEWAKCHHIEWNWSQSTWRFECRIRQVKNNLLQASLIPFVDTNCVQHLLFIQWIKLLLDFQFSL